MRDNTNTMDDYDFRVIQYDGFAWLVDLSVKHYLCSSQPTAYLEPLYSMGQDDDDLPSEGAYIGWHDAKRMVDEQGAKREDVASFVDEDEWLYVIDHTDERDELVTDVMREECCANHRI